MASERAWSLRNFPADLAHPVVAHHVVVAGFIRAAIAVVDTGVLGGMTIVTVPAAVSASARRAATLERARPPIVPQREVGAST